MMELISDACGAVATSLVPNAVKEGRASLVGVGSKERDEGDFF